MTFADRQPVAFSALAVILAASVASTIGGLPFNALPVMLGTLAEAYRLDPATVGLMGTVCFSGYLAGTLGAPFWMDRVNWRALTVVSSLGTAASFALSAATQDLQSQYPAWALIGFFASTMTCLGLRILGQMPDKVRALGVRQGVELSITAAVLFALPPMVIANWHYAGAAWSLAALVILLGLSAWWIPSGPVPSGTLPATGPGRDRETAQKAPPPGEARPPFAAWLGLAVFLVYLAGNVGLWAFLERIGSGLRLQAHEMGVVFAVLKLLGGAAAFCVGAMGERWTNLRAHAVALGLLIVGLAGLSMNRGFVGFAFGAWVWEFAFTCGCVLQAARIASLDASGRVVVLIPAAFALGSMLGPAVAGQLFQQGQPAAVLAFAATCGALPWLVALRMRDGLTASRASSPE